MNSYFILSIKPNLNIDDIVVFLNKITENGAKEFNNFFVALPYSLLKEASKKFSNLGILFGSPNLTDIEAESFTGPIAGEMLKNAGATFVLIGTQDERKSLKSPNFATKLEAAQKYDLQPFFCVGETYDERQQGKSLDILKEQLRDVLHFHPKENLILIYQVPFKSFQDYLPNLHEIEAAYQLCQEAASELPEEIKNKISWSIELPVDLAGFSENISLYPFEGFFFVKSGIFPHALHEEATNLFQIHLSTKTPSEKPNSADVTEDQP